MPRTPPPEEALTVDDIPSENLPNGTSTVLEVTDQFDKTRHIATIDPAGYVREVGTGKYVCPDWSARPQGDDA